MNAAFDVCVPCPILACSCFGRRPFRPSQPVPAAVGIAVAVAVAEGRRVAQRRAPGPKARGCYRRRRRRSRYHSSRPIYTRTQAPCRQDRSTNNTIYQDTTLPSSDKSRQSVTLISGRSAINAFAIYPFDPPFTAGPYLDRQGFSRPLR